MMESLQANSLLSDVLFYSSCSVISSMDEIFSDLSVGGLGYCTKLFKSSTEVQIVVTGWELRNYPALLVFM
jgi:hypothetical protein